MTSHSKDKDPPWLEWAFGVVGLFLFAAMLAVLISNAISSDAPPSIRARVESIERRGATYLVSFVATNDGDVTAAGVQVEAALQSADGATERKLVVIDFLPPQSERRGGFFFSTDPSRGRLEIVALGYVSP